MALISSYDIVNSPKMEAVLVKIKSLRVSSPNGLCVNVTTPVPLTLLVGLSGSGKSQILFYIYSLFQLLAGHSIKGLANGEYEMCFILNQKEYRYLVYINDNYPVIQHLWNSAESSSPTFEELIPLLNPVKWLTSIPQFSQTNTITKSYLLATKEQTSEILSIFQSIFDSVEDIKLLHRPKNTLELFFKEKGGSYLEIHKMSDGMLKTLYYLTEFVLSEPGTLLLVDEFENGLGLNCMGPLLEEMMGRDDLQLILSSHHPYVINNVHSHFWRIITRQQDTIEAHTAEELGIGQTEYDSFFELINVLSFEGGV